jgi:hypothetical protein
MNNQQAIQPEIAPLIEGDRGGNAILSKLRRKLGLTYIVSNPFRVPVGQSMPSTPESSPARKSKRNPFKVGAASQAV